MRRAALASAIASLLVVAACGSSKSANAPPPDDTDPESFITAPDSCAYDCPLAGCAELTAPYACQNLGDWSKIPHDDACGAWDGTYPAPQQGKCTASAPGADAAKYAGPDGAAYILPDGRRVRPAGAEWIFAEPDLIGGLTTAVARVTGTPYVLTVDSGPGDHAVRVVDPSKIGSGASPVVSYVPFRAPSTLNAGITFVPPNLVFVATNDGVVQALTLDTATGQLSRDDARSIQLPSGQDPQNGGVAPWYVSGVAASPDKKLLVVTPVFESKLLVFDVADGSPTFGRKIGEAPLPFSDNETFGAWFDPTDSAHVYVSMWASKAVIQVDLGAPQSPKVSATYATDKDPEQLAFLDARWMVVANDLGDTLTLVDRSSGAVRAIPVETGGLHGLEPTSLAYDAPRKRLYVALSGVNALAVYDVDTSAAPPAITPAGRIATSWWPSGVAVMDDGSLAVSSLRGHGSGPRDLHFALGDSDISDRMRGSIQHVPADLAAAAGDAATVDANNTLGALPGAPTVTCPPGADDFPIPDAIAKGPSKVIDHVFFIVRENKDFDGLFGDLPGVEGRADLTLKTGPGEMDAVWQNIRALAKTFSLSDNYYTDAVYSTQGHNWTTYGRATDFDERTWAISGNGRSARPVPGGGVATVGMPDEGSLFDWLYTNNVPFDLLGEIVGSPRKTSLDHPSVDVKYPGGPFQNILYNDLLKACYTSGRVRMLCNMGSFTYMTISNDHTGGVAPDKPAPETYCAVNDEATGMMVDAISRSPIWKGSLIVITEDDPSQGGEHIDSHRAPFVAISPWVKRGYVSKTHVDISSLHKLFAHILGKPYPNATVANAALPLDMFTSTPDYTPYTYKPRSVPLACGDQAAPGEKSLTGSWDFDEADEQPGLDAQVTRWMRGVQFEELPPRLKEKTEARLRERALRGE